MSLISPPNNLEWSVSEALFLSITSGGSRISQKEGGWRQPQMCYYLAKFSLKTIWTWKKLDLEMRGPWHFPWHHHWLPPPANEPPPPFGEALPLAVRPSYWKVPPLPVSICLWGWDPPLGTHRFSQYPHPSTPSRYLPSRAGESWLGVGAVGEVVRLGCRTVPSRVQQPPLNLILQRENNCKIQWHLFSDSSRTANF